VLNFEHSYNIVVGAEDAKERNSEIYTKPYCRVPPLLLGILCGWVIYSYRQYKKDGTVFDSWALGIGRMITNSLVVRLALLVFGFALFNFVIFI
jgi:hypothetical protein